MFFKRFGDEIFNFAMVAGVHLGRSESGKREAAFEAAYRKDHGEDPPSGYQAIMVYIIGMGGFGPAEFPLFHTQAKEFLRCLDTLSRGAIPDLCTQ